MSYKKMSTKIQAVLWVIIALVIFLITIFITGMHKLSKSEQIIAKCVIENKDTINAKDVCRAKYKLGQLKDNQNG